MSSSNAQQALLAHIAAQTKANLDFLVSQNYISSSDVHMIRPKLTSLEDHDSILSLSNQTQRMTMNNIIRSPTPVRPISAAALRSVPPPPPRGVQARAIWNYNEDGRERNDLSFRAGDIIEIINETNPDWYTGKFNGRTGLFPSNYVEKFTSRAPSPPPAAVRPPSFHAPPSFGPPGSQYNPSYSSPVGPPQQQQWSPAPPGYQSPPVKQDGYYSPGPPAPYQAPPMPPPQDQGQKKSKFGGLGGTLANAAAGGLGFGAGAAIGGDIVNSIF